jgi:hypothetical protein
MNEFMVYEIKSDKIRLGRGGWLMTGRRANDDGILTS